jgi:hypothetical protein
MLIAQVVAVHVTEEHRIDFAEPRVLGASNGAAGVVEKPRAVGILEDQCPV